MWKSAGLSVVKISDSHVIEITWSRTIRKMVLFFKPKRSGQSNSIFKAKTKYGTNWTKWGWKSSTAYETVHIEPRYPFKIVFICYWRNLTGRFLEIFNLKFMTKFFYNRHIFEFDRLITIQYLPNQKMSFFIFKIPIFIERLDPEIIWLFGKNRSHLKFGAKNEEWFLEDKKGYYGLKVSYVWWNGQI